MSEQRIDQATVEIHEALRALGMNDVRFDRMESEANRGYTGDAFGLSVCGRANKDAMRNLFKAVRLLAGELDAGCPGEPCPGCPGCQEIGAGPSTVAPEGTLLVGHPGCNHECESKTVHYWPNEDGDGPNEMAPGSTCPACKEIVRVVLVELGGPETGPTGLDKELVRNNRSPRRAP